jgi:hypothetical protein
MKHFRFLVKYFWIFFFSNTIILYLYYFNLFLFPKNVFDINWIKIVYIPVYSCFLSSYLSLFFVNDKKKFKFLALLSGLLMIIFLSNYQNNITLNFFFDKITYNWIEYISALLSIILLGLNIFLQLFEFKEKKQINTETEIFM